MTDCERQPDLVAADETRHGMSETPTPGPHSDPHSESRDGQGNGQGPGEGADLPTGQGQRPDDPTQPHPAQIPPPTGPYGSPGPPMAGPPMAGPPMAGAPTAGPPPFAPVMREPWINPAKRGSVVAIAVVALIVVAGAAFLIGGLAGWAVGNHGDRHDRRECGPRGVCMRQDHGRHQRFGTDQRRAPARNGPTSLPTPSAT